MAKYILEILGNIDCEVQRKSAALLSRKVQRDVMFCSWKTLQERQRKIKNSTNAEKKGKEGWRKKLLNNM